MKRVGLILATLFLVGGCDSGDGNNGKKKPTREIVCALGQATETSEFEALAPDARLELHLGFQGFLLVQVRLRAEESLSSLVHATMSVTLSGEEPFGSGQPNTKVAQSAGAWLTEDILVFMETGTVSDYENRNADIAIRLEGDEAFCTVLGSALLVDDDPCIHTGDEPICPDGGDPDGGNSDGGDSGGDPTGGD